MNSSKHFTAFCQRQAVKPVGLPKKIKNERLKPKAKSKSNSKSKSKTKQLPLVARVCLIFAICFDDDFFLSGYARCDALAFWHFGVFLSLSLCEFSLKIRSFIVASRFRCKLLNFVAFAVGLCHCNRRSVMNYLQLFAAAGREAADSMSTHI